MMKFKCSHAEIGIKENDMLTLILMLSEDDIATMQQLFGDKAFAESEENFFGIKVFQRSCGEKTASGKPVFVDKASVVVTAQFKLENSVKEDYRLKDVHILGECSTCGQTHDITDELTMARKKELILQYGAENIDGKWVCKHKLPLQFCENCGHVEMP